MERLGDPDETVRAQAARTVTHYARDPTTVSSALVDSLVAELEGPRHVRIACCEALGQCGAADPSVVDRVVSALEIRLRARERGVRRAAATALARVGQARPESLVPVVDLMSKRFQSDAVVRAELLPALAAVPVSAFSNPERVVEPALSELVETTDPSVSQAAGRTLAAIADESPGLFHAQLVDVSEQLEEAFSDSFMPDLRDVETSPLSTYWLLQVVATCAEGNRLLAKQFAWLVSETIETLSDGETDGFDSYDLVLDGHVTARGLARVTARVAAFGGLESYETVLKQWGADASKPAPDPTETAHHLVVSDSDIRTKTLEAVSDHAPETRLTGLLEALFEMDINLNCYRAVFESFGDLLPQTDDKRLHRQGVALLLDASRSRNWKIRQAAIQTLAGLGRTDVVPADEVIAHLVGISDIGSRADSTDADAVAELLQHAHLDVETLFTSVLVDYDRSEQSPKRRQTAIRLAGVLGKRHPAVRDQAVGRLVDAVSDNDRWVREGAADGLAEIDAVAPEALRPYRGRLNELKETATDEVANTLEQCFSARNHVD
jgi:HEAT repeat protein